MLGALSVAMAHAPNDEDAMNSDLSREQDRRHVGVGSSNDRTVPLQARWLGGTGAIPFYALALAIWFAPERRMQVLPARAPVPVA